MFSSLLIKQIAANIAERCSSNNFHIDIAPRLFLKGLAMAEKLLSELQDDKRPDHLYETVSDDENAAEQSTANAQTPKRAPQLLVESVEPQIIALYLNRSMGYMIAVVSVLASGCAFMPLDTKAGHVRLTDTLHHAQPTMVIWAEVGIEGGAGPPDTTVIPQGCLLYQLRQPDLTLPQPAPTSSHGHLATGSESRSSCRLDNNPPDGRLSLQQHSQLQPSATGQAVPAKDMSRTGSTAAHDSDAATSSTASDAATAANNSNAGVADPAQHSRLWQQLQHFLQRWQAACHGTQALPFCYVMYTSGSTGQQTAVCGTEAGILNRVQWMQSAHPLLPSDVLAFKTSTCFVDHLWELFAPLLLDVHSVVLPDHVAANPPALVRALLKHRVTHLTAVPTLLSALLPYLDQRSLTTVEQTHDPARGQVNSCNDTPASRQQASLASSRKPQSSKQEPVSYAASPVPVTEQTKAADKLCLRVVISSGEPLSWGLAHQLKQHLPPSCKLLNLYGSTETAADATCFEVPDTLQLSGSSSNATLGSLDTAAASKELFSGELHVPVSNQADAASGWPLPGFAVFILGVHAASSASEQAAASVCNTKEAAAKDASTASKAQVIDTTSNESNSEATAHRSTAVASFLPNKKTKVGFTGSRSIPTDQKRSQQHSSSSAALAHAQEGRDWVKKGSVSLEKQLQTTQAAVPVDRPDHSNSGSTASEGQSDEVRGSSAVLLAAGQVGEVAVAGVDLASGYYRNQSLTYQRFHKKIFSLLESCTDGISGLRNLLPDASGHISFFRTGDLGYLSSDGALHLQGRQDLQVTVQGIRVEVTEVEAVLQRHEAVQAAAACPWPLPANRGMAIAAYVKLRHGRSSKEVFAPSATEPPQRGMEKAMRHHDSDALADAPIGSAVIPSSMAVASSSHPTAADSLLAAQAPAADADAAQLSASNAMAHQLRQWCSEHLPSAAVPASIMILPQLPASSGGKLIRSALPPPTWATQPAQPSIPSLIADASVQQDSPSHMQKPALKLTDVPVEDPKTVADVSQDTETASLQPPGELHDSLQEKAQPSHHTWSEGEVLGLFCAALGLPCLEPTENFFLSGGNSLAATAAANALGILPDLITAFPSARKLTAALRQNASSANSADLAPHTSVKPSQSILNSCPTLSHVEDADLCQLPPLQLPHSPAAGTAQEEEAWAQQAQHTLSLGSQAGGWVRERAGATRWAGSDPAFSLSQSADSLAHCMCLSPDQDSDSLAGVTASELWAHEQMPPAASLKTQQAHSLQQPPHQLTCAWRVKLKECIDASPVVLVTTCNVSQLTRTASAHHQQQFVSKASTQLQSADMPNAHQSTLPTGQESADASICLQSTAPHQLLQQAVQQQHEWVFACSHGGNVVCVEGQSGRTVWQTVLPARAEAGLTITSDCQAVVVVGSNESLYLLELSTGQLLIAVHTLGAVKSVPMIDAWQGKGWLWLASHGKALQAFNSKGEKVGQHGVSGAVSAAVAFSHAHHLVFVTTLTGQLQAFQVHPHIRLVWTKEAEAPIFSTPVVDTTTSAIIVAAVNGTLFGFTCEGQQLWRCSLAAQIYAPLCLLFEPTSITAATGNAVVVGTVKGNLHCIASLCGQQLCQHFGQVAISTAAAVLSARPAYLVQQERIDMHMKFTSNQSRAQENAATTALSSLVITCTNNGAVRLTEACCNPSHMPQTQSTSDLEDISSSNVRRPAAMNMLAAVQLPGNVFSSPVVSAGSSFLGCRDEFLYKLDHKHYYRANET